MGRLGAAVVALQPGFPVCPRCSSVASSLEQEAAARLHVRLKNIWLLLAHLPSLMGTVVMSVAGLQGARRRDINRCATSLDYSTETF